MKPDKRTKEQKQLDGLAGDLEMVVTRFTEQYEDDPRVFWADRRTAHTELTDAFGWAMSALEQAQQLASDPTHDAIEDRMTRYREALEGIYNFGR